MTAVTTPILEAEMERELRHIRDLVFVRELLHDRGASAAELRECDTVIEDARARLAASAKQTASGYAAAA